MLIKDFNEQKHQNTLVLIFKKQPPSHVRWNDIEALLKNLGAELSQGSGSRVRIVFNGVKAVFHRPHQSPETDK